MKAVMLLEYGGPLVFDEVPTPTIARDEILVKIKSTAVNHLDLVKASGRLRQIFAIDLPWIPGHEFSGIVEQIGSDVAGYAQGDAVFGANGTGGAYAEYLTLKPGVIAKKPSNLSFEEAASVPVAAETAWQGIFTHGQLEKGQTILIHGGAGAVGAYAVQLASHAGARVIATASGDDETYVKSIGANQVIDYRTAQFEKVLRGKVDVIFDMIGGDTQKRSFLVLRKGGLLVSAVQPVSSVPWSAKPDTGIGPIRAANSCAGCHNEPFIGGGGDRSTEVFVLGQRFDFVTFDHNDMISTKGATDERGQFVTLQTIANERKTIGMNGSGFIEMLARQMTADLQAIRDSITPGTSRPLITKGVSFGALKRRIDGTWNTSDVQGLPAPSVASVGYPPSLIVMPFHQAGAVVSLRQFTNNAFTQHHGMQAEERFGTGVDEDGDGFVNELTRADITAVTIFQAALPVPGRVMPNDPDTQKAAMLGEVRFQQIGCATCHVPALPLVNRGWIYSEPNPYNPAGNLQPGQAPALSVDLTSDDLPGPRLKPDRQGIVWVPAYTDLKLHDITSGPSDPNAEPLDQNQPIGSPDFFAGNTKFITRKLWGVGNSGPYMHHGKFTTMREAILAHSGEALASRQAFEALASYDRDCVIEFLKTLQVLAPDQSSQR